MRAGWTEVALGEVVRLVGGGTPSRVHPEYYGGGIPWVTPKDMKSWWISGSKVQISQLGVDRSHARIVPVQSVLVVVRSGILKRALPIGITSKPVAINQDVKALIPHSRIASPFLARLLQFSEPLVLRWVRATTADNIPVDNLRSMMIPLPPLDEQRRIAAVLDHVDALRAKRCGSIAEYSRLSEMLYHHTFVNRPAVEWPISTVQDLAANLSNAIRTGPFGSQLLKEEFTAEGIPVIGIDNVVTNSFRWSERRYISARKYSELKRYTVRPRDVLITIMGTNGRVAVVPDEIPTMINTKHLCCITLDQDRCLPEYLRATFLWHPGVRRYLRSTAKGAIMAGLNMGIIKALELPVPPLNLQREFVCGATRIEALSAAAERHLAELDTLFASLQARAFAGELDVSKVTLPS